MIELKPCKSAVLSAHGYDATTQTLAVKFVGGGKVYHYRDVPRNVAEEFAATESTGKAYASLIRGKFEHEVILDEPADLGAAPEATKEIASC